SYQVDLPANMIQRGVHDVFHASLLRIHVPNDDRRFPGRLECQLGVSTEDHTNEWAVDRILSHYAGPEIIAALLHNDHFQVVWTDNDITWEPLANVNDCAEMDVYLAHRSVAR
ncbi:hypothetical protein B0H10DRAFT_1719223, partial [Mycena sp. CBHHK59/15]